MVLTRRTFCCHLFTPSYPPCISLCINCDPRTNAVTPACSLNTYDTMFMHIIKRTCRASSHMSLKYHRRFCLDFKVSKPACDYTDYTHKHTSSVCHCMFNTRLHFSRDCECTVLSVTKDIVLLTSYFIVYTYHIVHREVYEI